MLISPWGAGCLALVSAPQLPCQPWFWLQVNKHAATVQLQEQRCPTCAIACCPNLAQPGLARPGLFVLTLPENIPDWQ